MSIQDDIFDVEAILLEFNCDARAFERICQWAFSLENKRDHLEEQNRILKSAIKIVESTKRDPRDLKAESYIQPLRGKNEENKI